MNADPRREAALLLANARRTGIHAAPFPDTLRPRSLEDAILIQRLTASELGEDIGGWKVGALLDGALSRGAILSSRLFRSPALFPASLAPMSFVEAEIAFRFERRLEERSGLYSKAEVADMMTALPAIEVLDSRFGDFDLPPLLDRIADCMSNGALVVGAPGAPGSGEGLESLTVKLEINGVAVECRTGGHPTGDPLLRVVQLANIHRQHGGLNAGQVVTTGGCTRLIQVKSEDRVEATFTSLGHVALRATWC